MPAAGEVTSAALTLAELEDVEVTVTVTGSGSTVVVLVVVQSLLDEAPATEDSVAVTGQTVVL